MTWQDDIRDTADALTDSYLHRAPIHEWDHNKHRRTRHYTTRQPGLLAQLYAAIHPSGGAATDAPISGGKPASRAPLALEALSTYHTITDTAARWCTNLGLELRPEPASNIRQLAAKAVSFDEPTARLVLADLHRWHRWCRVMTGWEHVRRLRGVTCPDCRTRDTIRVNLTTASALCAGCGAVWSDDDGTLRHLAHHAAA